MREACALAVLLALLLAAPAAKASVNDFGIESTSASLADTRAGSHSDLKTKLLFRGRGELDERGDRIPWGNLRKLVVELPPGMVGNPGSFPVCDIATLAQDENPQESCSPDAQVGVIEPGASLQFPPGGVRLPLVNLVRPPAATNVVARFGFAALGVTGFLNMRLDSRRDYAVTATMESVPEAVAITGAYTTFWGVPTDHSHDYERATFTENLACQASCPVPQAIESGLPPTAFLSNPTSCGETEVGFAATSYEVEEGPDYSFPALGQISGCSRLSFEPSLSLTTTTPLAGAASGINLHLEIPQDGLTRPNAPRTADLKKAVVTLPEGVSLNPSAVDNLGSCSQKQIGVERDERQIVGVGARGAPLVFSFEGERSTPVPAFSPLATARSALEALPGIGRGSLAVGGRPGGPWTVDFGGSLSGHDVPPISGVQSEMQQLVVEGWKGTFRLLYDGESTGLIDLKADAADVQSALEDLPAFSPGDVRVSGGPTSGISSPIAAAFDIAFEGSLIGADVDPLSAVASAESSIVEVTTSTEGGSAVETHTVKEGGSLTFDEQVPQCSESSKLAVGTIETPMVSNPISASVYIADQGDNPSDSTIAGYLVAAGQGLLVKMPASLKLDPATGRIQVAFSRIPQLPLSSIDLHFKGGDRGVVTTPRACGSHDGQYELTPWSGAPPATGAFQLKIDGACRESGLDIGFRAGSTSGVGGAFTSFNAQVTRGANSEPVSEIAVGLPLGMAARLVNVGRCPEAALSEVPGGLGTGLVEASRTVCPADSEVGTVVFGIGSGLPFYPQPGRAYLTGPYRGAPLGLALVLSALAGPFDLGTVLVRVAVSIDPQTGRVEARSDPLPALLEGVPLQLRDLRIQLDRPGLMINPTSCRESAVTGVVSSPDTTRDVTDRFELGDCSRLGFRPQARLSFGRTTARNGHPSVSVELDPRAGDANIAGVSVSLPAGELLDTRRIRSLCNHQLAPERCPPGSRLGRVSLWSPLIDGPLEGPVYLRSPSHRLPDLLLDLRDDGLRFLVHGYVASSSGRLRVRFPTLPDYSFSKAVLSLSGGAAGIFVNSETLCAHPGGAEASFTAHNGRSVRLIPRIRLPGGSC